VPGGAGREPWDRFLLLGKDRQQGLLKPLGCRGLASPSLTSRDCQRQCHPAPGQDSTQGLRRQRGHPNPALVPAVQLRRGTRCPGASLPPPSLQLLGAHRDTPGMHPPCQQPWGVTPSPEPCSRGESWRRAGEGRAALPFPPRVSELAEAEHYLPRPSEAAARGCAPSAYLYRCKHCTPEIPSLYIMGQSLTWRLDLFLPLHRFWGACAGVDPALGHPTQDLGHG